MNDRASSREDEPEQDQIEALPDFSTPYWAEIIKAAPVNPGLEVSEKILFVTDVAVEADIVDAFKALGPDWEERINEVLRDAVNNGLSNSAGP